MKRTPLTSIELFVIIAIVILLPAMITASLGRARHLAKIPLCANNLRQIGVAVCDYALIYDGGLPNVLDPWHEESHPYCAYRDENRFGGKLWPYRLACLFKAGLIEDASLFYCPANTDPGLMYKSYIKPCPPNTSNEWGTLPQQYNVDSPSPQWVRCGYEWFPVDKNPDLQPFSVGGGLPPAPKRTSRRFDGVDPNLPYCTDFMRIRGSMSHNYDEFLGLNTLYMDGRVVFCDDPNVFSHRVWDFDPSNRTRNEIMAIYYQRILLLGGQ